jgi:hypothetical protein
LGASEEEIQEAMAIAMTVGATKIQMLQQRALDSLTPQPPVELKPAPGLATLETVSGPPPGSPFT